MDRDWGRLGKALKAARQDENVKLSQEEMAAELGVGRSAIQMIERGVAKTKPSPTMRAYARRVGWTDDSVDTVLAGGDPTQATDTAAPEEAGTVSADTSRLPLRIVHELEDDGALLDSVVVQLSDDARMVVVVKGKPNASPAEIKRNLEAWHKAQRHLRAIHDEGAPEDVANGA